MTKADFPHPRGKLSRGPWGHCKGRRQSFPRWPGALEQTAAATWERGYVGAPEAPVGRVRSCVTMKSPRPQGLKAVPSCPVVSVERPRGLCPTWAVRGLPRPATCHRCARLPGREGPSARSFGPRSDSRQFTPCVLLDAVTQLRLGFGGAGISPSACREEEEETRTLGTLVLSACRGSSLAGAPRASSVGVLVSFGRCDKFP